MSEIRHLINPDPTNKRTLCCYRHVHHMPLGDWGVFDADKCNCPGPRNRLIATIIILALLLGAARWLAGCVDLGSLTSASCEHDGCPAGQSCVILSEGRGVLCEPDGEIPDGGTIFLPDLSSHQPRDLESGPPPADMTNPYAWDPSKPRGVAPGCASNTGWMLTPKLYACPGNFNPHMEDTLCAIGWSIPSSLSIPASACASVPWGFFASLAHGLDTGAVPSANMRCDWAAPTANWDHSFRLGCGPAGEVWNLTTGPHVYSYITPVTCSGFQTVVVCTGLTVESDQTPWICDPPGSPYMESYWPMYTALQPTTSDGVLCAQP